jgi:hypothetical protein
MGIHWQPGNLCFSVSAPSVDSDDDDDDVASSRVTTAVGKVLPVKAKRLKAKSLHALGHFWASTSR